MHSKIWSTFVAVGILVAIVGCGTATTNKPNPTTATASSQSSQWLSFDASDKTMTLKLDANYNSTNGGMNFDGYSSGAMQIIVPQGWRVNVTFKNSSSSLSHSAMFVSYGKRTNTSFSVSDVSFPDTMTPYPSFGTIGNTVNLSFIADKTDEYAIVCAVPGHAAMGMWDTFMVSNSVSSPSITTK